MLRSVHDQKRSSLKIRVGWVKYADVLPTLHARARSVKWFLDWNGVDNDKLVTHPTGLIFKG